MRNLARGERGSVLVIVAIGIPTFILIAALALEFGSWYAHKRSLQNRVDAAAFAAGVAYGSLFPACANDAVLAAQITDAAEQYAGVAPSTYNASAEDADVTVNPDGPNPCQPHPTGDYSSPNGSIWTDVQVKQTVPSLFGGFGFVPSITANARVAVTKLESMTGFRPLAIANPDYTTGECAWAAFENTDRDESNPVQLTLQANGHWRAENVDVDFGTQDSQVNVEIGDCGVASERITYDNVGYVGVYDQGSAASEPKLRDLFFAPNSAACDGMYVSRYVTGSCSYFVTAFIDFGPNRQGTSVTVNGTAMTPSCMPPPPCVGETIWQGNVSGFTAGSGSAATGTVPIDITANWDNIVGPGGGTTQFDNAQQIMAGNDQHEGPIKDFTLSQISTHDDDPPITETIDLTPDSLVNAGPTTVLRARSGSGDHSLNGVVDCAGSAASPDTQSFADRMLYGCTSSYRVHEPSLCGPPSDPTDPPSCIQGAAPVGSLGFDALWAPGGNCTNTPNQWGAYPSIPRGDPRLITVPVTRIGNEFSSGDDHPVISFAAFYVTGWSGMPAGCGDPMPPATASLGGEVWGHFIRFVEPSGTGTPQRTGTDADLCDPNSTDIAACIATLVQ